MIPYPEEPSLCTNRNGPTHSRVIATVVVKGSQIRVAGDLNLRVGSNRAWLPDKRDIVGKFGSVVVSAIGSQKTELGDWHWRHQTAEIGKFCLSLG